MHWHVLACISVTCTCYLEGHALRHNLNQTGGGFSREDPVGAQGGRHQPSLLGCVSVRCVMNAWGVVVVRVVVIIIIIIIIIIIVIVIINITRTQPAIYLSAALSTAWQTVPDANRRWL